MAKPSCESASSVRQKKVVLFALVGMSPAVLTETVWALAHRAPAIVPWKVVAVTTAKGKGEIEQQLFEPQADQEGKCMWASLRSSLAKLKKQVEGALQFGATGSDILVISTAGSDGQTRELEDVEDEAANRATADFFLQELRKFTADDSVRLIVSLAGGRKTMSALLYGAMSLVGREDDEINHVLVPPPFDSPALSPRFYYPGQPTGTIKGPQSQFLEATSVTVSLASIPFVPLRNAFPSIGGLPGGFVEVVDRYRVALKHDSAMVRVKLCEDGVQVQGVRVTLGRRALRVMEFLLITNHDPAKKPYAGPKGAATDAFFKDYLPSRPPVGKWTEQEGNEQDIRREKDAIRKALQKAGLRWMPGLRKKSMTLPPFAWENPSSY